jgi:hypothetical protein
VNDSFTSSEAMNGSFKTPEAGVPAKSMPPSGSSARQAGTLPTAYPPGWTLASK